MKTPFPEFDEDLVLAIEAHLDQDYQTEIYHEYEMDPATSGDMYGLIGLRANGRKKAIDHNSYVRPMFQIFSLEVSSASMRVPVTNPCPDCLNFAYTRECPQHPDSGRKPYAERFPDGQPMSTVAFSPGGLYDRIMEMFGRELPGCSATSPWAGSNVHADPPAPNFRFEPGQFVVNTPVHAPHLSVEEHRRVAETLRDNLAPGTITMSSYFRAVAGEGLTGYTYTPETNRDTFTVHVEADTVAGDRSFSFEVDTNGE